MSSGLLFVLLHNNAVRGHPLGGPGMRSLVQAEISVRQLYIHGVRTVFLLAEVPATKL